MTTPLQDLVSKRYGDTSATPVQHRDEPLLHSMLSRGSCRAFSERPISEDILTLLAAAAFASPSKSDLQQRDIVLLTDPSVRDHLASLVAGQPWVATAPVLIVFCGNNRRQRLLHHWHEVPFANDHLDAFFNATADAAIALGAFVTAAEAVGLGCCPISAVRNRSAQVSELLQLPEHVFPLAGLAVGYPKATPSLSARLPLNVTLHRNAYKETGLQQTVAAYSRTRHDAGAYPTQRLTETFGEKDDYGWSDDKVRQYSRDERGDFGDYIRKIGFCLD